MAVDITNFAFAPGFRASATACGLKPSGNPDLALVVADAPCSAAGVFTTNRVKAAPVLYDQDVLAHNASAIRAVLTNAGNANACTGTQGHADTRRSAELAAYALRCQPDQVLILSTGVIGRPLDMDKLTQGIATVTSPAAEKGGAAVARAIMTTDLVPKVASRTLTIDGATITISGCCKGSGMIHPNMATMLAIVTTDVAMPAPLLQQELRAAADRSFNRISVDGDTSTNDTLLLLASGASGVSITSAESPARDAFAAALVDVCVDLAKQVARDGEGATKLVEILVTGASDGEQAHAVANSIARSPLVKTAIHGADPNWGRILCAAGYSGADINPDTLRLTLGRDPIVIVEQGLPTNYSLQEAATRFQSEDVFIHLDLGLGSAETTVWTCDFSKQYIDINALYTT